MLYQTTQEHEAFRQKMREFAESEVKPVAFLMDQNNEFPMEAVKNSFRACFSRFVAAFRLRYGGTEAEVPDSSGKRGKNRRIRTH